MKIPPANLRVVTQDVGGGFGTKQMVYREYPLVLEAARKLGRSVGWMGDRNEHFVGDAQGRDNVTRPKWRSTPTAGFSPCASTSWAISAAYLSMFGPYIPWLGATMATGPYDIGELYARVPRRLHPYHSRRRLSRGRTAGGGLCARASGRRMRADARRRRPRSCARAISSSPSRCPITRIPIASYDVGEFEGAMRACLEKADHARISRGGRRNRAARGKIRGFGMSSYIECTAWDDPEQGSVTLEKNGDFTVLIGTQSNGQGHETAYAQVVSQYLDVPLERIKVVQGDTDRVATGFRHRRFAVDPGRRGDGRPAPRRRWSRCSKELAADKLEAAVADLEIADGAGPDRRNGPRRFPMPRSPRCARRDGDQIDGGRVVRAAERDLSQRHARLRGRDRSRNRRDGDRPLIGGRRLRLHPEPAPARRPGPRRHRPGGGPGADGAGRFR